MPKPVDYYNNLIKTMPAGSERALLRVLSFRVGLARAIQKAALLAECAKMGAHFSDERQLRLKIVDLRKAGVLICSSSGESGYYLAETMQEYQEFCAREYQKKIADMAETARAMDARAKEIFPREFEAASRARADKAGQPGLW